MRLTQLSVPLHAESIALGAGPRATAVALGACSFGVGIAIVLVRKSPAAEFVCATLVTAGAIAWWLAVRGGRCDVTIGSTRIDVRAGPISQTAPTAAIVGLDRRAATSWRRWYAAEEIRVRTSVSPGEIALPTRKPREVLVVLQGSMADSGD